MRLRKVAVENFRNLRKAEVSLDELTLLCGENSSGKSNVLRAIRFALTEPGQVSAETLATLFDESTLRSRGRNRELKVTLEFDEVSDVLRQRLAVPEGPIRFVARTKTLKQVSYALNGNPITPEVASEFTKAVEVVYVPPIRDVESGGLEPLVDALAQRVERTRRYRRGVETMRESVEQAASEILGDVSTSLVVPGPSVSVVPHVDPVPLEQTIRGLRIAVHRSGGELPLASLGTGHQSQIVLGLYEGVQSTAESTVFLVEEPDNHLHPLLVEATANRLRKLSETSQVLVTTHSPSVMNALGFASTRVVRADDAGYATVQPLKNAGKAEAALWGLSAYGVYLSDAILARRLVFVEGPSDALVLRTYQFAKAGSSPEQMGVRVVACGSSARVAEAAELASALGLRWRAILDYDACLGGDHPALARGWQSSKLELLDAAALLQSHLSPESTLRRGARIELEKLRNEIEGGLTEHGPSSATALFRCFRAGGGEVREDEALIGRLERRQNRKVNELLIPCGVFLMKEDLESAYLKHPDSEKVAKEVLELDATVAAKRLRKELKKSVNARATATLLQTLVERNMLRYSEIEDVRTFAFEGVAS